MTGLAVDAGLYFLLFFTPFAFGGIEMWARGVFQIVSGLIVAAWAFGRLDGSPPSHRPRRRVAMTVMWVSIGLFVILVGAQLVPLPASWLERLSPGVHDLYSRSVPGYAERRDFDSANLVSWLIEDERDRIPPADDPDTATDLLHPPVAEAGFPTRAPARRTLSVYPFLTRQMFALLLCYVGLFAVVVTRYRTRKRLERLLSVAVCSTFAVSLFGIIQKLTWNGKLYWVRGEYGTQVFGPFVNPNSYAAFAGVLLPVAICLALVALRQVRRDSQDALPRFLLFSFATVVISGGILLSLSRAGILAAALTLVVIVALLLYYGRRGVEMMVLGALVALSVTVLIWIGPGKTLERLGTLTEGTNLPSLVSRVGALSRTVDMIRDHLVLGTGLGSFRYAFMRYEPPGEKWWWRAHNEYVELLCDTGLVGSMILVVVVAAFLFMVARPARFHGKGERYAYVGMLSGLAGLLLHSAVSSNLQVPANGMLLSILGAALLGLVLGDEPHRGPHLRAAGRSVRASRRRILAAALLVPLAVNTAAGLFMAIGFWHRFRARQAMPQAELNNAYAGLRSAAAWQPADASTYLQLTRVVTRAEANKLPLAALEGRDRLERLGVGVGAIARGIALNPADAQAWLYLATLYQGFRSARLRMELLRRTGEAGDEETAALDPESRIAAAALLKAAELEPSFSRYHDALARLYWDSGLKDEAAREIRDSFALTPGLEAHALLSDRALRSGLADAILEGIERARSNPHVNPVVAVRARAELLWRVKRRSEAITAYEALRGMDGETLGVECDLAIGRLLLQEKRYRESITILNRVVEVAPDEHWGVSARYDLGRAHARLKEHEQAVAHFRAYLAVRPDAMSAYLGLGDELAFMGRGEEAERVYVTAVKRFPDQPITYQRLIRHLRQEGKAVAALAYARSWGNLDPEDETARALIRTLEKEAAATVP